MKKISALLAVVISIIIYFPHNSFCADYSNSWAIVGSGDFISFIFRFEVLDKDSHWPIGNSKITLIDEPSKITVFSVFTNGNGIAVVLVKGHVGNMKGGTLNISAQGYRFLEDELRQSQLLDDFKNTGIQIPKSNQIITDSMVIQYILDGNYQGYKNGIFTMENAQGVGSYFVEKTIILEKLPLIIDNHPQK